MKWRTSVLCVLMAVASLLADPPAATADASYLVEDIDCDFPQPCIAQDDLSGLELWAVSPATVSKKK